MQGCALAERLRTLNFDYLVPYSDRGTLIHQVDENAAPDWQENRPFSAEFSIDWMEPGSALKKVLVLRDTRTGAAYPMLIDDIIELLRTSVVAFGKVSGTWRIKRTGRTKVLYTLVKVN